MAKRRKRYGDLTKSDARWEAGSAASILRTVEKSFNSALRAGNCSNALEDLTFASRQAAIFGLSAAIAKGQYRSGRRRKYNPPIRKIMGMQIRFKRACMRK